VSICHAPTAERMGSRGFCPARTYWIIECREKNSDL
jgi:hypothetical protein